MHRTALAVVALASVASVVGCVDERMYVDPASNTADMNWSGGETGSASLRGVVGELDGIDNTANDMWVSRESPQVLQLSGNVPHQAQPSSSVYLDIRIVNANRLAVGQELRQEGVVDTYASAEDIDGPALDVYVCPNGEGISGNADDIVVTRTGPDTFTFEARSTDTAQNLDVDLDLAADG